MNDFVQWLSATGPSLYLQIHEAWTLPVIQSLHIVGIGTAVGSGLMIALRVLGWVGTDQSLEATQRRFGPWLTGALLLLLVSGGLLIIAEPVRELITISFWLKMFCVAILAVVSIAFQRSVRRNGSHWEHVLSARPSVRAPSPTSTGTSCSWRAPPRPSDSTRSGCPRTTPWTASTSPPH